MSFLGIQTNRQIFKIPPGFKAYLSEVCGCAGGPLPAGLTARLRRALEPNPLSHSLSGQAECHLRACPRLTSTHRAPPEQAELTHRRSQTKGRKN